MCRVRGGIGVSHKQEQKEKKNEEGETRKGGREKESIGEKKVNKDLHTNGKKAAVVAEAFLLQTIERAK